MRFTTVCLLASTLALGSIGTASAQGSGTTTTTPGSNVTGTPSTSNNVRRDDDRGSNWGWLGLLGLAGLAGLMPKKDRVVTTTTGTNNTRL